MTFCILIIDPYVYVLHAMLVCLDLYVGCYVMCFYNPFVPSYLSFLCFGPYWQGVDLDLVVQAYIHTPRPISKVLDHFLLHVYVCLLASMLYLHAYLSRSRLCHALCPPWVCASRSLGPFTYVITSIPPRDLLGVTTCEIHLYGVGWCA